MNQDLTTEKSGSTTGFTTGTICTTTGLYKTTDGKIEFIEYIRKGTEFPPFPGGRGNKKCTWYALSPTTDGSTTSFESVKVEAGTI